MRKRREDEQRPGAPTWIVTFADMMSLLLTFFVFLLTFSTLEKLKYQKAMGSLQGALGIVPREKRPIALPGFVAPEVPGQDPVKQVGPEIPPEKILEEVQEEIELAVRRADDEEELFDFERLSGGLRIRPSGGIFDPSSAELKGRWRRMVRNVGDVLLPHKNRILIRGLTDNQFLSTSKYRDPVQMGVARALAVAAALEDIGVASERIGIGATERMRYPYPNDSAKNRARNRTFEILVLAGGGGD